MTMPNKFNPEIVAEIDDIQEYIDGDQNWVVTVDAVIWAKKFVDILKTQKIKKKNIDEDLMTTWFAAAINAGYDEGMRRAKTARPETEE